MKQTCIQIGIILHSHWKSLLNEVSHVVRNVHELFYSNFTVIISVAILYVQAKQTSLS